LPILEYKGYTFTYEVEYGNDLKKKERFYKMLADYTVDNIINGRIKLDEGVFPKPI
jgi:hypothetical protein